MERKLVVNFLYQASYQVLLIILPVITIPVVSGALGPDGIGIYNYINSIVSYFVLAAGLGMANYGIREISVVKKNNEKLSKKFWELEYFNIVFSLISMIVYIMFSLFTSAKILFLVSGISVLSCLFDITWFFAGIEDFRKITIRNFIVRIVSFILIIFLVRDKGDLLVYIAITAISQLVSQMSLWISIKNYIHWAPVTIKEVLSHFKSALEFFIAKISVTLYQNATKTILGIMSTMSVVGYYSNSFSLVLMSGNIVNAMNTIMIPRMSSLFGEDDEKGMIQLLQKTMHIQMYFTVAIMFGIIAVSSKIVGWFFGPEFEAIKHIIPWLAPVVVTQSFQMAVASQYLIPKKEMKEYNKSILTGALITVGLTTLLVPFFEVYGAVIGINVGYLIVSILRLRVLLKDTNFIFEYKKVFKFFISGIIMWGIIYVCTNSFSSSILTTVIQVVIGVASYLLITWILKVNPFSDFIKDKLSLDK